MVVIDLPSERAELEMAEEGEEEEVVVEDGEELQLPRLRRTLSKHSENGDIQRKLSRNIEEEDRDIVKMREYMEQKGL